MKKFPLQLLLSIPVVVMTIVLTISFVNIIDSKSHKIMTSKIDNITIFNKMAVPKYTPVNPETKVQTPKVKVATINDKEDGQRKRADNTKPSNIADARKQYEASGRSFGIDVSKWDGNINWPVVKQSGVEFAMIRVGYRGTETGAIMIDPYFSKNIKGALANGIHVGVYFYSVAKNEMEALEEAKVVVDQIKPYRINYPVAFDLETFNRDRLSGVSNDQLNKNAVAFLNYIKGQGYTPMHYGSKSRFGSIWNMSTLNNYKIWLAHYADKTDYRGKYNMWQYTSKGIVPGISSNVDMNIAYFKLSPNATDQAKNEDELNANSNEEVIKNTHFNAVNEEVITTANVNFRKSPTTDFDNKIYDDPIPKDTKMLRIGVSDNGWAKVIYNNITGYISNEYLTLVIEESDKIES